MPILTILIVWPAVTGLVLLVRAAVARLGSRVRDRRVRRRARARRRPRGGVRPLPGGRRPVRRDPLVDPADRRELGARRQRHRPEPHRLVRRAGADRHRGGLEGRRRRLPPGPVLGARPRLRVVHGGHLRRQGRLPLLRAVRGDAHPAVLPHRLVRRPAAPLRRGEVPDLLARRWPRDARGRHRPVLPGPRRRPRASSRRTSRG